MDASKYTDANSPRIFPNRARSPTRGIFRPRKYERDNQRAVASRISLGRTLHQSKATPSALRPRRAAGPESSAGISVDPQWEGEPEHRPLAPTWDRLQASRVLPVPASLLVGNASEALPLKRPRLGTAWT